MAKAKTRKIPKRMCVSCREMKERRELFRIVLVEDVPVLDLKGKINGRGAYICKQETCVEDAFQKNRLQYHLKTKVPETLAGEVRAALASWHKELARAEGGRKFRIGADGKPVERAQE